MVIRRCLTILALASALGGCEWQGPATITLKDGSVVRCPNLMVTETYLSCQGLEGGEHVYPINTVATVTESN